MRSVIYCGNEIVTNLIRWQLTQFLTVYRLGFMISGVDITTIPIVLTGTIIPNGVATPISNTEFRRAEYLRCIRFYLKFAPVIFLENSHYPLKEDPDFRETERLQIRQFQPSEAPERGKGYQEFEMLDAWIKSEANLPLRWLKATGRYQFLNISSFLSECHTRQKNSLLIDQAPRSEKARTYLFSVTTVFYKKWIAGLYKHCNDRSGDWIERVMFQVLRNAPGDEVKAFAHQPRLLAISGATGDAFPSSRWQWFAKQTLRSLNRLIDQRYLWFLG